MISILIYLLSYACSNLTLAISFVRMFIPLDVGHDMSKKFEIFNPYLFIICYHACDVRFELAKLQKDRILRKLGTGGGSSKWFASFS